MRHILLAFAILLLSAVPASADCSTNTVVNEYGRVLICTTCCLGTSCSTTCSR